MRWTTHDDAPAVVVKNRNGRDSLWLFDARRASPRLWLCCLYAPTQTKGNTNNASQSALVRLCGTDWLCSCGEDYCWHVVAAREYRRRTGDA
jgi:hypothetical protein